MSDYTSLEMGSVDKPPNRFQVNPVNHNKPNLDNECRITINDNRNAHNQNSNDVPHEVYRRLLNNYGEAIEDDDDTFNLDDNQLRKIQQCNMQPRYILKYCSNLVLDPILFVH